MTNQLIPNTFVPGTKAKAQEVNANFIALAEEIQGMQSITNEQFSELRSEFEEKTNLIEENYAQIDLVNTGDFTNTVLKAPNGICEYDGQTINVKSGVEVLIPDGKTTDGKLNNLKFTTESVATKTITNLTDIDTVVFLDSSGNIEIIPQSLVFYKKNTPTTLENNVHWYNIEENKWYKYVLAESKWVQTHATPIANVEWNESSMISNLKSTQPINLVKTSDLDNFYTLRGVLPKDLDYVIERYTNDWGQYTIYKSGWVRQAGYCDGKGDSTANFYIPMVVPYNINVMRVTGASNSTSVNIWVRNEITSTYMKVYTPENTGKVWSIEGYRLDREEI